MQEAGAFMLVLEHIPSSLGESITQEISIPTIGIGAGPDCDGQVLVINDALGFGNRWPPFSNSTPIATKLSLTQQMSLLRK
ncbi:3-methyl-2-oxobutanoate hydroxymethyltransferase [Vibrio sp. 10N.261.55.F4]